MRYTLHLKSISDDELLRRLSELLQQSRRVESELVAHIGEVDARRLYAREAASSMFAYCTEVLHLSEPEAYLRIAVARASRKHAVLLEMLSEGRLHLSGIAKLAPCLTEANRETLLARAAGKSKREIEELVAELAPKPDLPATIRKLPERASNSVQDRVTFLPTPSPARSVAPAQRPALESIAPALLAVTERGCQSEVASDGGPVHSQRRAPRETGAAPCLDAFLSSRRRFGCHHRRGRH